MEGPEQRILYLDGICYRFGHFFQGEEEIGSILSLLSARIARVTLVSFRVMTFPTTGCDWIGAGGARQKAKRKEEQQESSAPSLLSSSVSPVVSDAKRTARRRKGR